MRKPQSLPIKQWLERNRVINRKTGCWEWSGFRLPKGYGIVSWNRKRWLAHRAAYVAYRGRPIPKGKIVMHKCDNPPCFNPRHLKVGTQRDNIHDSINKGRAAMFRFVSICHQGHPKTKGYCRICRQKQVKRYRAERKDFLLELGRKYQRNNREKCRAWERASYARHAEERRARQRAKYAATREEYNAKARARYARRMKRERYTNSRKF